MTRRASLPGADELFRNTTQQREQQEEAPAQEPESTSQSVARPTSLQVAKDAELVKEIPRAPRHDEKITFYCTGSDLIRLEKARLGLRSEFALAADRGRIVRAALSEILDDFESRGPNSALVKRIQQESG